LIKENCLNKRFICGISTSHFGQLVNFGLGVTFPKFQLWNIRTFEILLNGLNYLENSSHYKYVDPNLLILLSFQPIQTCSLLEQNRTLNPSTKLVRPSSSSDWEKSSLAETRFYKVN
jgi:hypothetical protein